MKPEFADYLLSIGITAEDPLFQRIDKFLDYSKRLCAEEVADIFVSDYREPDTRRMYSSLFLLTDKCMLEAPHFSTAVEMDVVPIKGQVARCELTARDFDVNSPKGEPRLNAEILFANARVQAMLRATNGNCEHLYSIIYKYIVPNLVE